MRRRGKPNRGGGRFNRGRGRGSRGRGRQPEPEQPVQHHGHGGRKGGADFMYDYDDGLDDDYQEDFTPQTDQASRQVISNKGNDKQTFSGRRFVDIGSFGSAPARLAISRFHKLVFHNNNKSSNALANAT